MSSVKALNWGIMATGNIAGNFARTARAMGGEISLVGAASRDGARARAFAEQYGIPKAFESYEAMASDPDIDIVYIATPHSHHYECMMLCLAAGKHVLCEKSFTVTAAQAREVFELAARKSLFVMEAYWTRFLPATRKLLELLCYGAIGEVNFVIAASGFRNDGKAARKFDPALAGGALLDMGIYNIAFACMVLGYEPDDILTKVKLNGVGTDASHAVILSYQGGKFAQITTAIQTDIPHLGIAYGSEGRISLDKLNRPEIVTLSRDGEEPQVFELPCEHTGFEYQIREAQGCIAAGKTSSDLLRPEYSVAVMEIMDRIRARWGMKFPFEQA